MPQPIYIAGPMTDLQKAQLQAREKFVAKYFAEHGWNLEDPTIEQIMEVREQPEWKNPK